MARDKAYREAEKKIEEARQSGATKLNLSKMNLTELPDSLAQITQLQELNLSRNQLTSLPEWLDQFTRLLDLELYGNQLTRLPESLGQLSELQSLNLGYNQFEVLSSVVTRLVNLRALMLHGNQLVKLPSEIGYLSKLTRLTLENNKLLECPEQIGNLINISEDLWLADNQLTEIPPQIGQLNKMTSLSLARNQLTKLPESIGQLASLETLNLEGNHLTTLPVSLAQMKNLSDLRLAQNPLNPELDAAYKEGLDAVKRYLRTKMEAQMVLNESKLILVGEGEVGKSCLLDALRGDPWMEHVSTHGIEIKPVKVTDHDTGTEITLNGWDFGGQRVYRPTHQLFFSAPAVYLVVWKPREGPQQGSVKEWIKLIKHREPDAKILVVATHGGPGQRQPDIDKQELWDLFGRDTVHDFFHVDSKPDENTGERRGIVELRDTIARVAAGLPEMGRMVPARWQQVREALKQVGAAYLPVDQVLKICREHNMDEDEACLFVSISHRLGHLIYYEHDPLLRDIVVLKPDWLATAISFVLDDKQTREAHGLVSFERLGQLWNDPTRAEDFRYPFKVHPVFLRLMERFDLSYRVVGLQDEGKQDGASLIAQLVPDVRPDPIPEWTDSAVEGDEQQAQICRIAELGSGQSATAEGLFYQLIVRLHKYSMGRVNYAKSVHWQRGLVLDDDYNGRALMEYTGNDLRITVRAPYPERFLSVLTNEVKWLVESFWAGLRCDVMVPCLVMQPNGEHCSGLFEVRKLIENKRRKRPEQPCPICNEWQEIDGLLRNAPTARRVPFEEVLFARFNEIKAELEAARMRSVEQHKEVMKEFAQDRSKLDSVFAGLMQALTDEAKEGPRLFSFQPIDPGFFDRPWWISEKFRLTLWCEHSRKPLPILNKKPGQKKEDRSGVYDLTLPRDWFVKAAPFFKVLTATLSLVLPVASSATKMILDDATYKGIEKQLDLGQKSIDSVLKGGEKLGSWLGHRDAPDLEHGEATRAQGAILRELHSFLKEKDPKFGGLVRVQNKRQEFLWVHSQFATEY